MRKLGSLKGAGRVEIKGADVGAVTYAIDVWQDAGGGLKSASGTAQGDEALLAAFEAGVSQLKLQTGGSVDFLVARLSGSGDAEIQITGPVPGF